MVVEACLMNSLLQCSSVQTPKGSYGAVPSQDLNPCPCYRLNYKLNCVWCTVELKMVGNLDCRIKVYGEKNRGTSSIQLNILILQLTVYVSLSHCISLYLLPSIPFLVSSISVSCTVSSAFHALSCLLYHSLSHCIFCL